MNVYVMYKFDDYEEIKESIHILENTAGINIFYFPPDMKSIHKWKGKAKEKIKAADAVCYLDRKSVV